MPPEGDTVPKSEGSGGAGEPGGEGAEVAGSMIPAESASCRRFVDGGAGWDLL